MPLALEEVAGRAAIGAAGPRFDLSPERLATAASPCWRRWTPTCALPEGRAARARLGPYFGFIGKIPGRGTAEGEPRLRDLYVTQLENLAACPWQLFLVPPAADRAHPRSARARLPGSTPCCWATSSTPRSTGSPAARPRGGARRLRQLDPLAVAWPEGRRSSGPLRGGRPAAGEEGIFLPGLARALAERARPMLETARDMDWAGGAVPVPGDRGRGRAGRRRRRGLPAPGPLQGRPRGPGRRRPRDLDRLQDRQADLRRRAGRRSAAATSSTGCARGRHLQAVAYLLGSEGESKGRYLFLRPGLEDGDRELAVTTADEDFIEAFAAASEAVLAAWEAGALLPPPGGARRPQGARPAAASARWPRPACATTPAPASGSSSGPEAGARGGACCGCGGWRSRGGPGPHPLAPSPSPPALPHRERGWCADERGESPLSGEGGAWGRERRRARGSDADLPPRAPTARPAGPRRRASTSPSCSRPGRGRGRPRRSSAGSSPGPWARAGSAPPGGSPSGPAAGRAGADGGAGPRSPPRCWGGWWRSPSPRRRRPRWPAGPPASWRRSPPGGAAPDWLDASLLPPDPERARRARALLGTLDHLAVRTIHAFCRGLLADHPLEARVHPDLVIDADGHLRRGGRPRGRRGRPARRLRRSRQSPPAGARHPRLRPAGDRGVGVLADHASGDRGVSHLRGPGAHPEVLAGDADVDQLRRRIGAARRPHRMRGCCRVRGGHRLRSRRGARRARHGRAGPRGGLGRLRGRGCGAADQHSQGSECRQRAPNCPHCPVAHPARVSAGPGTRGNRGKPR